MIKENAYYLGSFYSSYQCKDVILYLGFLKSSADLLDVGGYLDKEGTIPVGIVVYEEEPELFDVQYLNNALIPTNDEDQRVKFEFDEIRTRAVALGLISKHFLNYNISTKAGIKIKLRGYGWYENSAGIWWKDGESLSILGAYNKETIKRIIDDKIKFL